jgi:transcriptional regulator with XRE-family HTH domain
MAQSIGVKQQNWARWESGAISPGAEMLVKICRAHACSADWLLGLDAPASHSVVASGHAVVAVGRNARASSISHAAPVAPSCAKCPYKRKLSALEKLIAAPTSK